MAWRPENDGDVNREAFEVMIQNRTNVQDVLIYIFKNKKRKYKKPQQVSQNTQQNVQNTNSSKARGDKWNVVTEKSGEGNDLDFSLQNNLDTIIPQERNKSKIHPIMETINMEKTIEHNANEEEKVNEKDRTMIEEEKKMKINEVSRSKKVTPQGKL